MTESKYLSSASIITIEYVVLRDDVLVVIYNGFSNMKIEKDSKIVIDCYNKKCSLFISIILLVENIWRLI